MLLTYDYDDKSSKKPNKQQNTVVPRRRQRRQSGDTSYYGRLASATGGQVIKTSKAEIQEAVKIVMVDLSPTQVRLLKAKRS